MTSVKWLRVRVLPVFVIFCILEIVYGVYDDNDLPCSSQCSCKAGNLRELFGKYNRKHSFMRGYKYRNETRGNAPINYADKYVSSLFWGTLSESWMNPMAEVSCILSDKKVHLLSDLLNDINVEYYTSLEVKCDNHEEIVWNIPIMTLGLNIFVNEHCRIRPQDQNDGIALPPNLWIFENYGDIDENIEIKYAQKMIALVAGHSSSEMYPRLPAKANTIETISYQKHNLKTFDCHHMSSLVPLDTLNLAGNKLAHFPQCLADPELTPITFLTLAHNVIADLSNIMMPTNMLDSKMESSEEMEQKGLQIEILDLSFNEIAHLDIFVPMTSLTTLDLSYNLISKLDMQSFYQIPNLSWLSLANNRIHMIHESAFRPNMFLQRINLSSNQLTHLQTTMLPQNTEKLDIDLRVNNLKYPVMLTSKVHVDSDYNTTGFITIQGSGNPYSCDCTAIEFQNYLNQLKTRGDKDGQLIHDMDQFECHSPVEAKGKTYTQLSLANHCVVEQGCPQSCNCYILKQKTMVVNCSGRHLMEVPYRVPDVHGEDMSIIMLLNNNPIQLLGYRPYFHLLNELYMHNCLLSAITMSAMEALVNVNVLTLHKNLLKRLPPNTANMTMGGLRNLTLHGNRWACDCNQAWMAHWLVGLGDALWAPTKVQCGHSRSPVLEVVEVGCGDETGFMDMVLMLSMMVSTLVSTLYVIYYYRREMSQLLYVRFGVRVWDAFKYGDVYRVYDAFVFYSQNNYKWVVDTLVDRLERGNPRYKLCLHFRDFPKDEVATDNVPLAVNLSRCSLLVLSKDFLDMEWKVPKIRNAFQRYLLPVDNLIVIVTEDIKPEELTPDLRDYVLSHDLLYINDPNFWKKLEYFLPPCRFSDVECRECRETGAGGDHSGGQVEQGKQLEETLAQTTGEQPQLDHPQLDHPHRDDPRLDDPRLDDPRLDDPRLDDPNRDDPHRET